MASILPAPRIQFIDANGEPIVGGKVYTYEAGTTDYKTTWKDQGETTENDNPLTLDSGGRANIWIKGSYKIDVRDANDVSVPGYPIDNVLSYTDIDLSGITASVGDLNSTTTTAISTAINYSIELTDRGKTVLVDATSTNIDINLLSVTSATNRYKICIKKIDLTTNYVKINTNASELIEGRQEYYLYDYGDFIEILCDGSSWNVVASQIRGSIITKTTSFAVSLIDNFKHFNCNCSSGDITVSLPAINTVGKGFNISLKKIDSSSNGIILDASGAELIDGEGLLYIFSKYEYKSIRSDGFNWYLEDVGESGFTTGDVKLTFATSQPGWVIMDDGTIGNASSGASNLASERAKNLYILLYTNVIDIWAPVSGGRSGNALNDFNAGKTLTLPRALGRAIAKYGHGTGLSSRVMGERLGHETHTLTESEMPEHHHNYWYSYASGGVGDLGVQGAYDSRQTANTTTTGSGHAHNIMQPTTFMNILIKL